MSESTVLKSDRTHNANRKIYRLYRSLIRSYYINESQVSNFVFIERNYSVALIKYLGYGPTHTVKNSFLQIIGTYRTRKHFSHASSTEQSGKNQIHKHIVSQAF
jgi:hypothetical protein